MVGIAIHLYFGEIGFETAAVQGVGMTLAALLAHQIYVRRNFVDRGDPALAWLTVAWSIALFSTEMSAWEAARAWGSLSLMASSLLVSLQMHRQPSTSGIQFRAGALAGLGLLLDPGSWGIIAGLALIQVNTRPAFLREWVMLGAGLTWILCLGGFVVTELDVDAGWTAMPFKNIPLGQSGKWLLGTWGVVGAILLLREQGQQTLRVQNTRMNTLLGWGSITLGSLLQFDWAGWWGVQYAGLQNSPALALTLAFFTIALVPKRDRHERQRKPLIEFLFWVFVGTLLVLFAEPIVR